MQCKEGTFEIEEASYENLRQYANEAGCIRSPSSVCKIGHTQDFKVLSKVEVTEESESEAESKEESKEEYEAEKEIELLKKRVLKLEQQLSKLFKKGKKGK